MMWNIKDIGLPIHPDHHAFAFDPKIRLLYMQEVMVEFTNLLMVERHGQMLLMKVYV